MLSVNAIRCLAIDAIQQANSGHPGLPLGAAPMAYVLWRHHMKHHPQQPQWANRDRFVLSAGHGSMLLYSLLHLTGYDLPLSELKAFRQWGSKTPGHPEFKFTVGVEATTGPLGQGSANVVGMAIAERMLAHRFNRQGFEVVDHHTFALVSDGDLMEGISAEAASLAGHLKLGKLHLLYDANDISLDGPTSLTFTEQVQQRYESYGWHVQVVQDADTNLDAISDAIAAAKAETQKPSLLIMKTTIGFGSPNKAGKSSSHGSPLGVEEVVKTKQSLGYFSTEPFAIAPEALEHLRGAVTQGEADYQAWQALFAQYQAQYPELAEAFLATMQGDYGSHWQQALPQFEAGQSIATRDASAACIQALAQSLECFVGGDADLSCSTMTSIKNGADFCGQTGAGRNIRYGVREHAMGAIANGIAYHGGLVSFAGTFFVFSDYMRPSVRLAALNHLPVVYVWTHDSIGVGEDGPTHQPIEHLMSYRCIPNLRMIRPADAAETAVAWRMALEHKTGPTALVLSRQKLKVLDRNTHASAEGVSKGGYVLRDTTCSDLKAIFIATGSEVHLALEAQRLLEQESIATRVVSMPCFEVFDAQDEAYRNSVLPPALTQRISVEAGITWGWEKYVGAQGQSLGLNHYGASAPGDTLFEKFGLTAQALVRMVRV